MAYRRHALDCRRNRQPRDYQACWGRALQDDRAGRVLGRAAFSKCFKHASGITVCLVRK